MKKSIILANGKAPRKSVINFLKGKGFSTLICADGGANSAKKIGVVPDYIIGDFDSALPATLKYYQNKAKMVLIKDQNSTDVEKCLDFLIRNDFTEVVLTGVTGDRLDHTICNLGIILKYFSKISLNIIAENSFLKAYTGKVELDTIKGETISLYGFDSKTKIKSEGLKYPLENIPLPFGKKESTSNVALSKRVKLTVRDGIIFIIRDFNILKENGLF
ncbi:MAG TPA: thiamine diphosphokinase [Ignavibacteriaceae bacterium]|nr:thiamine diphosphokinase [Ignavibacteriaceae bacterium]